jgi:hypothetical protein
MFADVLVIFTELVASENDITHIEDIWYKGTPSYTMFA